ncbi:recombinase family protein [Neptuniibacter sp.]|uniref:recombinase family protein n=1 Tax=Neptuniibacter sp. TaxID=1962643 RepID=UPI0026207BE1|nr:recombinase family protein [Neptuniibacter sp.]MCP4597192.1 recombinase family protein [Neptuniibacter sp.]
MAVIGYARVSSTGQKLDVQQDKLNQAGCERVYEEKRSGANTDRAQLLSALDYVREGDTFVVTKLDRLARSMNDLSNIAERLNKQGVHLHILDQNIDTSTSEGRLMFNLLGSFAEFERDIRAERQADGIAKAKENGVKFGRSAKLSEEQKVEIRERAAEGSMSKSALAAEYGIGRATLYRVLSEKQA